MEGRLNQKYLNSIAQNPLNSVRAGDGFITEIANITKVDATAGRQSSQPPSTFPATINTPSKTATQNPKQELPSKFSLWVSKWISDWWGLEIACWVIAVMSLIAIVITLESYKGKPLPEWSFGIMLNSIISIFATISQVAMMKPIVECVSQLKWLFFIRKQKLEVFQQFDDASRGPVGSLILLRKLRGIHLACLGAVITIISVAFGPFAQQVVIYPLHLSPVGVATAQQVFTYPGSEEQINIGLSSSISEGLSLKTNLSAIVPFCSTGNCTWIDYTSLGICSSISDISSMISSHPCNLTSFEEIFESAGVVNPGYSCFNYTLPVTEISISESPVPSITNVATLTSANVDKHFAGLGYIQIMSLGTAYRNISSLITAYLIFQPGFATSINSSFPIPIAYELNLDLCLHTYSTTVSKGVVNTTMLSSQTIKTSEEETYSMSNATTFYKGNSSYVSVGGDIFGISNTSIALLQQQLQTSLVASCHWQIPQVLYLHHFPASFSGEVNCDFVYGFPFINALENSTDPFSAIQDLWENLAVSMTNAFRNGAGGDIQVASFLGTAFEPVAFVETQYFWLILPFGLVFLTLIFLLATILQSQRLGSRVWKSSNLATLQGLHSELHTHLGGLSSIAEMEKKVKKMEVRFEMKGGKAEHGVEYRLVESKREAFWMG